MKGVMVLGEKPKNLWDQVAADYLICKDESGEGDDFFDNTTCAIYDRAVDLAGYPKDAPQAPDVGGVGETKVSAYPAPPDKVVNPSADTVSSAETVEAPKHLSGPLKKEESLYAENVPELYAIAMRLGWSFFSPIPGQPQSNGLAERMVRRVNEGGRACLVQSGLPREWWAIARVSFCFAIDINLVDGDSSYNRRHNLPVSN